MILAGDLGGTKSLIGLFEPRDRRPARILVKTFVSSEFTDVSAMVARFLRDHGAGTDAPSRACFGVAGPVLGETARVTHSPLEIDARAIRRDFGIGRVRLLNDLEAMAFSVPVLDPSELHVIQTGTRDPRGNISVIAAGTGLGEALMHNIDGQFVPSPTEAGHSDWAARNERDIAVLRALIQRFGHAAVEHVVSGPGLINLCRVTHSGTCPVVADFNAPDAAAEASRAAIEARCPACAEALDIFVCAYGAEAGNLALRTLATGGVYLGGGISPKILPALTDGRFVTAFNEKGTFTDLVSRIPVHVILNPEAGLLGAAVAAL